tara:strand:- start:7688 stop:8494 length:807 start_codon:yes stop_codon:yes gene_type:complete
MKNDNQNFIVVFDMDETLGHFSQLNIFWSILKEYFLNNNYKYTNKDFFNLIDTFNLILRPEIIKILNYLIEAKKNKKCDKIMIYTNNQGPKSWAESIRDYFHDKLKYKIFDQIIGAFKIGEKKIEICRTSHYKSIKDLINCTKLPETTKILFIDDQHHPEMEGNNVVYLHIKPYIYKYKFIDMINSYYTKNFKHIEELSGRNKFYKFFESKLNSYSDLIENKSQLEEDIDIILSKKIIIHLSEFFKTRRTDKTRKRKKYKLNVSHKKK